MWSQNVSIPQTFGKRIYFHLEMLPKPTLVVVSCLLGPPSGSQASVQEKQDRVVSAHPSFIMLSLCGELGLTLVPR